MFTVTVLVVKLISFDTCVTDDDIPSPLTFDTADVTSLSTAISSLPITILPVPLYTLNEQFTRFVPSLSLISYVNVCPPSAPTYKSKLTFALLPIAGFNFNDKVPGAVTFALNLIFWFVSFQAAEPDTTGTFSPSVAVVFSAKSHFFSIVGKDSVLAFINFSASATE